jgi:hypothetical protein
MKTQLILRHRGSGRRRLKRYGVANQTLHYAIAFTLFGIKMAALNGGSSRDWMSIIGQGAAEMLLTSSRAEIEEWLTNNLLLADESCT